ncbi:MAG: hypothetical protein WB497_07255 [Pseudolabrys sp.]|jgi:hypothetical protein
MRRILSIALALAGIFVSVMASPSKTTTEMDAKENHVIVEGLYVALPNDMKTFPAELVPMP